MTGYSNTEMRGSRELWGMSMTRALGFMLVPLVIAGLFIWGLWDPTERMNHVTAAVVNNDEPVEVDGQLTPLGRVLAAELIGATESENFEWQLTDDEGAEKGLESGKYVTVVTIPENFSRAATSLSKGPDEALQATLDIHTSERAKLLDAALSAAVTQTATEVLNTQLGEAFVGNVFVGFTKLGEGLDDASDGAGKLADGADQLAEGSGQLATGLDELLNGTGALEAGVGQLSAGAGQLSSGADQLAGGANSLAEGLRGYAGGVHELADGTRDAAAGSKQLAGGVGAYVESVNGVLVPLLGGLTDVRPQIIELRDAIASGQLPVPPEQQGMLLGLIDQVLGAPELLQAAIAGGNTLADGAAQSAAGLDELAAGAAGLAAGADGLAAGAGELAAGVGGIASGARELSSGTGQLAAQVPELTEGVSQLAEGASELAGGTEQAAKGTRDLAEGLAEAVSEIPRYSESERDRLAEIAVNPVSGGDDEAKLFAGSGAPLFLSIALWAGGLAAFMVLQPLWSRTREAALSEATITLRSAGSGMLLGAIQGALAALFVALLLKEPASHVLAYAITGVLVGVAFGLVNQGLVALFHGYGRFVSFVVLVVGFVAGIVSTAPGVLASITSFTPVGTAIEALQRITESGAPGGANILMLLVWGGLGMLAIGAAVHRERKPA
ncbi:YhgE/Pip domain-containing protein [Leucobacter chinensis]|uniref:YhgE/Pip domain-containing protein n=1 Tax=Leucobacter chinensis TaxID=2851010 RepID=UPI001C22CF4C|nr:YhgE/Pip domain-containing protein [Leucobacter chinensis]